MVRLDGVGGVHWHNDLWITVSQQCRVGILHSLSKGIALLALSLYAILIAHGNVTVETVSEKCALFFDDLPDERHAGRA